MFTNFIELIKVFPNAVIAGTVIAAVCSFLGTFVIMKRVVFIGIALSEVSAAGIALGIISGINPSLLSIILTIAVASFLAFPFETTRIPRDAVTGLIFVFASALSILLVSKSGFGLEEVRNLLHGDLILIRHSELWVIFLLLGVFCYTITFLRPTLYTFLDRETSYVTGLKVSVWEFLYFFALGLTISVSTKTAGLLIVFCYLVVAPTGALLIAKKLLTVLIVSVASAITCTIIGLYLSFSYDLPTNQIIAVATCLWVGLTLIIKLLWLKYERERA
jgi:zinc transport system permease protein